MICVISLFSLLNDDNAKIENGRIFPMLNSGFNNMSGAYNMQIPFLIIFTDKNP